MSLLLDRESSKNAAPGRWAQSLFRIAFQPACITVVVLVVALLVTLISAGSSMTGLFGAIGSVWLAVHQVPVYIGGTDLGALPLLPTMLVFAGVARCAYRFTHDDESPARQLKIVGAAIGGPIVITVIALAMIEDSASVLGVSGPGPIVALACVAAVHGVAALVGVGLRALRSNAERWGVHTWLLRSIRAGALAALAIFAAGALLVVVGVFLGWTQIASLIGEEPTIVGQLGLLVLSILYLPNVVVSGSAMLAGSTAHIGEASFALAGVQPGPVPAVPVLGALPQGDLGGLWQLVMVVCAGIGAWLGWRYRDAVHTAVDRLRFFIAAGAVAAMISLALGFLASGQMGSFGHIGVDAPIFALYVFGWITGVGLVVGFGASAITGRRAAAPADDEYADPEYADPEYDDRGYAEDEYFEVEAGEAFSEEAYADESEESPEPDAERESATEV